ncbi:MAG: NAD(P)H-binding protein [Gammaproteobacteria bacterium]
MKAQSHHRPSSRSLALALLAVALLVAATIAAAFTREAEMEAARANGLRPVVLLAGASGQAGELVAQRAIAEGLAIRVMTRDTVRARATADRQWLQLDLRDVGAAHEAARGVEFVVCWIGAQAGEAPDSPHLGGHRGIVNLIDAARAAGVKHFVFISSAAADSYRDQSQQPRLGYILPLPWKTKVEDHLKASGLLYTVIDQGALRSEPGAAAGLRVVRREAYRSMSVSRGDVARVAVDALRNPAARNKSFALFNDADTGPDTWRKELHALRRDAPTGNALEASTGPARDGRAVEPPPRIVPPTPARERLMIEEPAATGETSSVGWTRPPSSRSASTIH